MRRDRFVAGTLVVATALALGRGPVPAAVDPAVASLGGTVRSLAGDAPLTGARVLARDLSTGNVYASDPAGSGGVFRLAALPPAEYAIAVESAQGLYVAAQRVPLAAGQQRLVRVAVDVRHAESGAGGAAGKTRRSVWGHPASATGLVIGIAVVLGFLFDELTEDESIASESGL